MNKWIKIQKVLLFIPYINFISYFVTQWYYKSNPEVMKKIDRYIPWCLLPFVLIACLLATQFKAIPYAVKISEFIMIPGIPYLIAYFVLRAQCQVLTITPEEIGKFYSKFLLLKNTKTDSQ